MTKNRLLGFVAFTIIILLFVSTTATANSDNLDLKSCSGSDGSLTVEEFMTCVKKYNLKNIPADAITKLFEVSKIYSQIYIFNSNIYFYLYTY